MSQPSPFMGLTLWTAGTDPYSHAQLSQNFSTLDSHNHNPAIGGGVQIGTSGIQNAAITTALLAQFAVQGNNLAAGSVTLGKLDPSVLSSLGPLGQLIMWWRPNASTPIPSSPWAVCAGQTLSPSQHDFPGGGSIALPNFVGMFPYGSPADGSQIGAGGGSGTVNLNHSHTVNGHSHTIQPHSHVVNSHAHNVVAHNHGIFPDGVHAHTYDGGSLMHTRTNAFLPGIEVMDTSSNARDNTLQSTYIAGDVPASGLDKAIGMDPGGAHSHGSATGNATAVTDGQAPATSSATLTTDASGAGTDFQLGSVSMLPPWVGVLFLIRVKAS